MTAPKIGAAVPGVSSSTAASTGSAPAAGSASGPAAAGSGSTDETPTGGVQAAVETPWQRLDPRMLIVGPLRGLVGLIPLAAVLLVTGRGDIGRLWGAVAAGVVLVGFGVLRWRTTRYRITDERVELHSGWLNRQRRSVPRDRIRTVDLTSQLLHRIFGLSVVRVSAGAGATLENSGLSLDAVSKAEAERLRQVLLRRSTGPVRSTTADPSQSTTDTVTPAEATRAAPEPEELARLRWSWIRFAPLTVSSLAGVAAVVGTAFNWLGDLGLDPSRENLQAATDRLGATSLWVGVTVVVAALLVIAILGAMLLFAERWYAYRLTREPDGTLRVRRGLLTRRSLSVSEERLRGAVLSEPLLLRAGRGAQCRALSTGLSRDDTGGALQPPAPRAEAHRVAAVALRADPAQITRAVLRRHPRAALRRRMIRSMFPAFVLVGVLWLLDAQVFDTGWLGPVALVALPLAALLGLDRYRNLGHALTAGYLVSRQGSLVRRTAALQRTGVIGWTFRQSVFQRRAGLITLEAVAAAGDGGYAVTDIATADAATLADAAVPDLLTPFRNHPS